MEINMVGQCGIKMSFKIYFFPTIQDFLIVALLWLYYFIFGMTCDTSKVGKIPQNNPPFGLFFFCFYLNLMMRSLSSILYGKKKHLTTSYYEICCLVWYVFVSMEILFVVDRV